MQESNRFQYARDVGSGGEALGLMETGEGTVLMSRSRAPAFHERTDHR